MELTPKQQTSEAIRQAETILILTGQHPSVDQVAAVIALASILSKFGKRVSAVVTDSLPQATSLLDSSVVEHSFGGLRDFILKLDTNKAQVDKLRYEAVDSKLHIIVTPSKGSFAPSDVTFDYGQSQFGYDIVITLGVPTRARLDRVYEQNVQMFNEVPIINIDFHRSNESYGAINLIEPYASSLCEMLVALSESLQSGIIDAEIASALLMGIVASTDRFTAAHTTSKSLTVAAQMMAAGAKQQAVVKALYRDNRENRDNRDNRGSHSANDGNRGGERTERPRQGNSDQQPRRQNEQPVNHQPQGGSRGGSETAERAPRQNEQPLPIIDPGHIELSEPEPQAKPEVISEPSVERVEESLATVDQLPQMADFAAAAEILAQRKADEQPLDDDASFSQFS